MCSSPTSEGRLIILPGVLSPRPKNISMNACRPSRCVLIATTLLKNVTQRTRPNDSGTDSFPSGHAATSALYTRLATVNRDQIEMSDGARGALDTGLQVLNFGTAWARIEGGWHYPSDTLVSIALGNFCGMFFNDAFLGLDTSRAKVAFAPRPGGGELTWQFRFAL